ncbi:MAG: ATP-dependent DNA helicase RecQ [Vicingaceae bacterium]
MTPQEILKKYWGFDSFRPLQHEIIDAVLNQKDCLALLPTGGGKSLCYQVPAVLNEGICLVVSPLLSLMADQVDGLRSRGIKAMAVNSFMSRKQIDRALDNAIYGGFKLLYVSPERLRTELFIERFKKMNVSLIAVDEAHCISQWGYDFRPSYLTIGELRELKPEVPVLALTATATELVVNDILQTLSIRDNLVFRQSYARTNLSIIVQMMEDKKTFLRKKLTKLEGSSIVYARSRLKCQEIAEFLQQRGIPAQYYHAGLSHTGRQKKQEQWAKGKNTCMVATNAFGMGIDKADVRMVIHIDLPDSIEAYYQEAGRAGRDGKESESLILCSDSDQRKLVDNFNRSFPPESEIREVYDKICNHFQITLNSGLNETRLFDLGAFANKYALKKSGVMNCLKQLHSEGFIELSEGLVQPSRVKVVSKNRSGQTADQESLQNIMDYLLRAYSGIIDNPCHINEDEIARNLNILPELLKKRLNYLTQSEYLEYHPSSDLPAITFLMNRIDTKQLNLGSSFGKRKETAQKRIDSVLTIIREVNGCRMNMVLNYFGEEAKEKCGKCDLCLGMNRILTKSESKDLKLAIDQFFSKKKTVDLSEIADCFPGYSKKQVIEICRELLADGVLEFDRTKLILCAKS